MIVLGIESSCDETAAAVVRNGKEILSSVVASQVEIHHPYGGVVPELASRKHNEAIAPVVSSALEKANISEGDIDGIAVTQGPGLIGALLVGFCFAKGLAYTLNIPWVGVNHLDGHIHSVFLEPDPPPFPFVAMVVSGGHTNIYHVTGYIESELLGQTLDDAAGEAFDKVAKMLGLGYPGGGIIGKYAERGDPKKIDFPRSYLDKSDYFFSFSGIKTAVSRYIQLHPDEYRERIPDIAAGFQEAVVDVLTFKLLNAAVEKGCDHVALVGGVAANRRLRKRLEEDGKSQGITVHIPGFDLCTDNAAMIAAVGYHYLSAGIVSALTSDVYSRHRL